MKSFQRSKRKLEDSYDFDSMQVGWKRGDNSSETQKTETKMKEKAVSNKSYDWNKSFEGFSGMSFDSFGSSSKPQVCKKAKLSSSFIVSSSEEEEAIIDDEEISWNSSDSCVENTDQTTDNSRNINNNSIISKPHPKTKSKQSNIQSKNSSFLSRQGVVKPDEVEIGDLSSASDDEDGGISSQVKPKTQNQDQNQNECMLSPLISSCPSSQSTSPGTTGLKASEWMKMMDWQTSPQKQHYQEEMPEPDSAKKNRKKYKSGGLAENLFRLQGRERSGLRIWRHQLQSGTLPSTTKILKLEIESYEVKHSLQLAHCLHLSSADSQTTKHQLVLFTKHHMEDENLTVGSRVEVHAPWQELKCGPEEIPVILCTNYVKLISPPPCVTPSSSLSSSNHPPPHPNTTQPSTRRNFFMWTCPCISDSRMNMKECPAFNSAITTLKNTQVDPTTSPMQTASHTCTIHTVSAPHIPDGKTSLRESLERHSEQPLSFTAGIARVFHWFDTKLRKSRCSVLIEDCGTMALIQLPNTTHLVDLDKHTGCVSWFSGLKVLQRLPRDRDMKLFSVIDVAWSGDTCQSVSQDSQSQPLIDATKPPPCFCYILTTHDEDIFDFNVADKKGESTTVTKTPLVDIVQCDEMKRITCLCRLMYLSRDNETSCEAYITDQSLSNSRTPYKIMKILPTNPLCESASIPSGTVICCTDVCVHNGEMIADEFTRVTIETTHQSELNTLTLNLERLTAETNSKTLVFVEGTIGDIDEDSACSWEECDICGSDQLTVEEDGNSPAFCEKCKLTVTSPVVKLAMSIFLKTSQIPPTTTVKVLLLQSTIKSLLPEELSDEGYDINEVIGKTTPILTCLVQSKPDGNTKQFELQEIQL